MRSSLALSCLVWSASASLSFASVASRDFNASMLQELPNCAVTCLDDLFPQHNCQVESPCFCADSSITKDYSACISDSCASTDWLVARRFQADTCNLPVRNKANISRGINWSFLGVETLFVGLRIISRTQILHGSGFRWDDFVVVLSFAVAVPLHVSLEMGSQSGLGQDTYLLTIGQITDILKWSYIGGILFQSVVILSKIAIVLLYLRIWTTDSTKQALRTKCWAMIAVLVATVLAFDLAMIFQCQPVTFAWSAILGGSGTCVEREPLLYTFAALNIFFNIVIFALPIQSLRKLDIPWQKKAGVCSVFVLGFVVTVTSVIRLQYLVRLKGNVAWNLQYINMWSVIEASISLICACMPSVTGLLQRCAGAEFYSSSDDLIANSSATTQKQLLRRGNNFYTVDRHSAEAANASMPDEHFDLEKAPENFPGTDQAPTSDTPYALEDIPHNNGEFARDDDHGEVHIFREDDAGNGLPGTFEPSRPRSHQFKNQATNMAALLYNSKVGGRPKKVEISHDPPSEPAEAKLTYRDEYNILHEVTVTDIPQPRLGPFHSGHGIRPTVLRAITEADSRRTSRYLSGEYASPVYSPATPGSRLDDNAVTEADSSQMVSASSQTDLYEPHNLSPIESHASSPIGRRIPESDRPSLSSRSASTQTDEQTVSSLASRTSSPAGNAMLMSPMVLSRTASTTTEDSELLPSPLMASPGRLPSPLMASPRGLPLSSHIEEPASPRRESRTAATQIDDSDALPLSPRVISGRSPSGNRLEKISPPPIVSQHTSTQTVDSELPFASPLSLASPLYSPVSSPSETSFVGLASLPPIAFTAETQTEDLESTPTSPLSTRRSSSTQTIGFTGLASKRRLGI